MKHCEIRRSSGNNDVDGASKSYTPIPYYATLWRTRYIRAQLPENYCNLPVTRPLLIPTYRTCTRNTYSITIIIVYRMCSFLSPLMGKSSVAFGMKENKLHRDAGYSIFASRCGGNSSTIV